MASSTFTTRISTLSTAAALLLVMGAGCAHEIVPPAIPTPPNVRVSVGTPEPVAEPAPPVTPVTPVQEIWQDIPMAINYPSGGSRLNDDARDMMREVHASVAHRTDIVRVSVHGHADSRGSHVDNERLAMERAQGVVDFLVGDLGMPRELFEVHGHADDQPISSGATAADRLLNRRVTFRILVRRAAAM